MFRTLVTLSLLGLSFTQTTVAGVPVDQNTAESNAGDIQSAVDNSVGNLSVNQALQNATGTAIDAVNSQVNPNQVPVLKDVSVGWGNQGVLLNPIAGNNANPDDWLNNYEYVNIEKVNLPYAEGEWNFGWDIEGGDQWALWDQNGEIVLVDWQDNGEWNVVGVLGNEADLEPAIVQAAQSIVDNAWSSDASQVSASQIQSEANNLANQALNSPALQNFLAAQGQNADSSISQVVSGALSNTQGAVDNAQNAAGTV